MLLINVNVHQLSGNVSLDISLIRIFPVICSKLPLGCTIKRLFCNWLLILLTLLKSLREEIAITSVQDKCGLSCGCSILSVAMFSPCAVIHNAQRGGKGW